ncbi:hypothetical protein CDLVIII_1980 [Clostridium sp. DL-VIII]|uniref:hypothetical protein n=1 Tax=Clostridium sp. DL-VIII TaxID=641107 RepID=UPI00023B01EA|nr:hypothetical protein CDLVIII_1980 [Clostridium sp. DL-VIII]
MKLSIIYFSKTGKTHTMAEEIPKGMKTTENIEVGIFDVENIDYEYIKKVKQLFLQLQLTMLILAGKLKNGLMNLGTVIWLVK